MRLRLYTLGQVAYTETMRRSEAARYARWSATVALLLAGITAVVYLKRDWVRHVERTQAPPPAPVDVARQSSGITFKKFGEQNRTIFEVNASKSTEFKGQDASLLEEVRITIFGKAGDRHDVIHTHSCQYAQKDGSVICGGDVRFDLMSAADAKLVAQDPALAETRATHVETRGVTFNRTTGTAQTDERVTFAFPNGSGDAVGLEYKSEEGTLRLQRDVRLRFTQPAATTARKSAPLAPEGKPGRDVHVKGASLDFARDSRLMHLHGPAEAETPAEKLTAGEISLALDEEFRVQTLVATAGSAGNRPQIKLAGASDQMNLDADTLTAHLAPGGWISKLDASGAVRGSRNSGVEADEMSADAGTLDLRPRFNQPKQLNLSGSVTLQTRLEKTGDARTLQTAALRVTFSGGAERQPSKPQTAETLAAGVMEWTDSSGRSAAPTRTKLQADKLIMDFADTGKARQLQANGNVQTERWVTGHAVQTANARNGQALMSADGGWSQMDLQGDVKLKEGDRSGQAERATFQRASQSATLTGQAVARDATTETHAPRITFSQSTGEIVAEGGVRSTDFSSKSSTVQLAPAPANITSDSLQANSRTGRALYSGHARLWQGESVLEANSIELLRDTRVLNASGSVRAVFPQAPASSSDRFTPTAQIRTTDLAPKPVHTSQGVPKKPQLWHATCATLTYDDKGGRAHLQQNVVVQSADQKMRGPVLDLYFTRSQPPNPPANSASSPGGAQQISRAVGTGGVVVEEGERRATAERGEYTAANGRFVMSGGNPTLYDGSAGTTTGLQLTFFLADDTIIVDSDNGSRTLTKHRVQK
jgi:lipopolysaccharide export system protein LptA